MVAGEGPARIPQTAYFSYARRLFQGDNYSESRFWAKVAEPIFSALR